MAKLNILPDLTKLGNCIYHMLKINLIGTKSFAFLSLVNTAIQIVFISDFIVDTKYVFDALTNPSLNLWLILILVYIGLAVLSIFCLVYCYYNLQSVEARD